MSGLDPQEHKILEIACLITDENLKIISDEFHMVLHQPDSELDKMDDWCQKTHGKVIILSYPSKVIKFILQLK